MKKKDGIVKWVLLVDEADDDDSTWQIITPILSKSSHGGEETWMFCEDKFAL
ncbi:hypothetical protein AB3S75_022833 [Citrus x aurantiifolia]